MWYICVGDVMDSSNRHSLKRYWQPAVKNVPKPPPPATVLFNVCSIVTVECCVLYPCCVGVFGMLAVM